MGRDGQDQRDDEGRDPVIDGPTGGLEFLWDFFFHCRRGKGWEEVGISTIRVGSDRLR